jgi:hypothetical protein
MRFLLTAPPVSPRHVREKIDPLLLAPSACDTVPATSTATPAWRGVIRHVLLCAVTVTERSIETATVRRNRSVAAEALNPPTSIPSMRTPLAI